MWTNLGIGALAVAATVVIHTVGLILLTPAMAQIVKWFRLHRHGFGKSVAMVATVLGIFALHTVEVWFWAAIYFFIGAVPDFPSALYFSSATFSTVGYGDITLHPDWRLLSSLEGLNGFLLIGWSTAYLVSASTRHGPFKAGDHF